MKRFLAGVVGLLPPNGPAFADQLERDGILIEHLWTRATAEGAAVGVGYLAITNNGREADKLTGGTFDGTDRVEVHQMRMESDKMMMRKLNDGPEIKPGETVKFSPGAHIT